MIFLSPDPNEKVDRTKLLDQEKKGGNDYKNVNAENMAKVDKRFECVCFTGEEHASYLIFANG